jgi:hypothetical protein
VALQVDVQDVVPHQKEQKPNPSLNLALAQERAEKAKARKEVSKRHRFASFISKKLIPKFTNRINVWS